MSPQPPAKPSAQAPSIGSQIAGFSRDIKLSHTIFALPFALAAAYLVARVQTVPLSAWLGIVAAMFFARTSAMGFNRLADREFDAINPRTTGRDLAAGKVRPPLAWALTIGSGLLFGLVAYNLSPLAGALSPIVLMVLWGYSLAKRFTALCHLWLGVALGLSPPCVWIALTGGITATPLLLSGIILTWVAGFDILYALQDRAWDAENGLHSIPVRLGEKGALALSAALHLLTLGLLVALPLVQPLSYPYYGGVLLIAGLLLWEHLIVKPGDLSKMNAAFFTANSWVSLLFLASVLLAST